MNLYDKFNKSFCYFCTFNVNTFNRIVSRIPATRARFNTTNETEAVVAAALRANLDDSEINLTPLNYDDANED